MRILPAKELNTAALTLEESVFVESLYLMLHLESMDSFRAKCLNARTIIREIHQELLAGRLDEDELASMCKEAVETLESDSVVKAAYPYQSAVLLALLKDPPSKAKKGERSEEGGKLRVPEKFLDCVADFAVELGRTYCAKLCESLPQAIAAKDTARIIALTGLS
jgi:hypothetical protein